MRRERLAFEGASRYPGQVLRAIRPALTSIVLAASLGCAALRPPPPVEVAPEQRRGDASPTVVVVYDLEGADAGLAPDTLGRLSEYFRGKIGELPRFRLVPEAEVRARLTDDKRAAYTASRDEASQIELGRAVSASHILRPAVLRIQDQCTTTVALFDLETEARAQTVSEDSPCAAAALRDALARLAQQLAAAPGQVALEGAWKVSAKTMLGTDTYTIELVTQGSAVEGNTSAGDSWSGRLDGRVLTATWIRNGTSGRMRVAFSKDGRRFTGAYGLGQGAIEWPMSGQRAD